MLRFREYVALNERLGVPDAVVKALPVFMARIREILDETERAFRELQSSYGRDPLVSLNVPGMPSEIRLNMTVDTRARRDAVQAGGSWRGGKKPVLSVFVSLKETSVLLKDRDFVLGESQTIGRLSANEIPVEDTRMSRKNSRAVTSTVVTGPGVTTKR